MEQITTSNLTLASALVSQGGRVVNVTKNESDFYLVTVEGEEVERQTEDYKAGKLNVNIRKYENANRIVRQYLRNKEGDWQKLLHS